MVTGLRGKVCAVAGGAGRIELAMAQALPNRDAKSMHGFHEAMGGDPAALFEAPILLSRRRRALAIAEAVLYLASDRSSFTTGSFLTADGGSSA